MSEPMAQRRRTLSLAVAIGLASLAATIAAIAPRATIEPPGPPRERRER